jgi:hypothetical protein
VLFRYNSLDFITGKNYLLNLHRVAELLREARCADIKEVIFSVRYVPFWHCSNQKELTQFLLYMWYDMIRREKMDFDDFVDKLNFDELDGHIRANAENL